MADSPTIWLLTAGDYSSYAVVGAFRTEAEAQAVAEAIANDDNYDRYQVEEVPVLGPITTELLWTEVSCSMTIFWHGRIGWEHLGDPTTTTRLRGLPGGDDDRERTPPAPLTIEIDPTEHGYTLGVSLHVYGTDLERVRKVYSEQRAMLVADPASATIKAWVASPWLPRWTFGRGENAALAPHLADALRAAGKANVVATHIDEGS